MNKEASYAVLGLGRYGRKLAVTLAVTGSSILIADRNEEMVNRYADRVTQAVCGDLASEAVLNELGLEHIDIAIVVHHHLKHRHSHVFLYLTNDKYHIFYLKFHLDEIP